MLQKQSHSVETILQILTSSKLSKMLEYEAYSLTMLNAGQQSQDQERKPMRHLQLFCSQTSMQLFTFSRALNTFCETLNTL